MRLFSFFAHDGTQLPPHASASCRTQAYPPLRRPALWAGALLVAVGSIPPMALGVEAVTVMVPMRDGTRLATNVFSPSEPGQVPTLMIRTPYGKDFIPMPLAEQICDGLGYALVVQDTRGRGGSEGVDDVFLSDGWAQNQDGYDTLDWTAAQPFSNGEVGLAGASALGIASYLAAGTLHPALKAMWVGITPSIFYDQAVYQGGVFREALVVDWLNGQGSGYMLQTYQDHPLYDDLWASLDLRERFSQMTVPIYHWGGWYDIFAEGPVAAFDALEDGGAEGLAGPQKLLMGPWTHIDRGAWSRVQGELAYPDNSLIPIGELNPFKWFDRFLKPDVDGREPVDPMPVRFYVMGDVDNPKSEANHWERATRWPVPGGSRTLYFGDNHSLTFEAPDSYPEPQSWVTDPLDPSPTIGGRELSLPAGPRDQRQLLDRDDVLVFETEVLTEPVKVVGTIKADLWFSSDSEDTDIMLRLVDVYPDGRAMLVTDGAHRARHRDGYTSESFLTPGAITQMEVEIGTTAILFEPGHRIQVIVSSTNSRRFQVHHNTSAGVWSGATPQPVANTLYLDEAFASSIELPVPYQDASRPGLGGGVVAGKGDQGDGPAQRRARQSEQVAAELIPLLLEHGRLPGPR